jgi:predicted permease
MACFTRLRSLFRKQKLSRELDEELSFHLAMREQWNADRGMPPTTARREARLRFGSRAKWRESMSEIDLALLPQTILQDLRYGQRILLRNFGFTAAAILALALGIGANTAAFTGYKAFFARTLDASQPSRMANMALVSQSGGIHGWFSYPDYVAYRDHLRSFSGIIAHYPDRLTLTGAGETISQRTAVQGSLMGRWGLLPTGTRASTAEFASTHIVSENYFQVLGIQPIRGRTFDGMTRAQLEAAPSVLISENYWQRRFGADPSLIGRSIRLNGVAFTVIGITPRNFVGTSVVSPDFWLPFTLEPLIHPANSFLGDRTSQCCRVFGRLAPGVTMAQAQAEMTVLANTLRATHAPDSDLSKPLSAQIWSGSPFPTKLDARLKFAVGLIMAAFAMVLVIACANVASLQLARATSRQGELAMRLSLGATRRRLIRQLLTESALLGLIAGAVALLFSWALLKAGVAIFSAQMPPEYGTFVMNVSPDPGIFAYVFAISILAGILFGLAPALESSRSALAAALKANSESSPLRKRLLRESLIAAQVAVSLVLMIAGGMLIHSSIRALKMDTGYDDKHVVDLELQFPDDPQYTTARRNALWQEMLTRVQALPSVTAVTHGRAPDGGGTRGAFITTNGVVPNEHNTQTNLFYTYIESNYFDTLGIPVLFGRAFQPGSESSEPSVVLSQSAAQQVWPGQNPIGRTLRITADKRSASAGELMPDGPTWQVIGVVRDTRGTMLDNSDSAEIYLQLPAARINDAPILIRTASDPNQLVAAITDALGSVDSNLMAKVSTLDYMLKDTEPFLAAAFSAGIATAIGLLGLLLASMGIYGTVSYMVVLRTREIGIRMALGAKKRDILRLMIRESARPVLAGLCTGACLAVGASYLLRGVLYGLNRIDGISFTTVPLLFLLIAFAATWLPSRRAMRVQPMSALRCE